MSSETFLLHKKNSHRTENGTGDHRLSKSLSSRWLQREGSCERKPSEGLSHQNNPPQRQNCKIMLRNSIFQFGNQLGEKGPKGLFNKMKFPASNSTRGTRISVLCDFSLCQAFCSAAKRNRIVASSARVAPAFGASSAALRPLTRPSATAHAMASCAAALTASASP